MWAGLKTLTEGQQRAPVLSSTHIPPSAHACKSSIYLSHEEMDEAVTKAGLSNCHTHQTCLEDSLKPRKLGPRHRASGS